MAMLWGWGRANIAAKASIDRNWRNATVYCSRRAVPFQSTFWRFGGFRLFLSKAAGTVLSRRVNKFNPALYEPFYDSACAPMLP